MLVYLGCVFCVLTASVQAGCQFGYTGPWCKTKCSNGCVNGTCVLHNHGGIVCSRGCNDGWAGESCRTPCAKHCRRCNRTQSKDCQQCQPSYYGETCSDKCETCGPAGCDKDGMCKERPANCDGGVMCGKNCIKKCRFCNTDATATATCSVCQSNYTGGNCEITCPNCRGGACTQDGCRDGCRYGYYGQFCRKKCSIKCLEPFDNSTGSASLKCKRVDGTCLKGCKDGHFGERCQHRCNTNCKACQQLSGRCTGKCKDGHYGVSCEHKCRHCKHDKCANDGHCYQCPDGYYGKNCNRQCDPICTSCERYAGVCQPQNLTGDDGGTVPKVPLMVNRTPAKSQRTARNGSGPEIKSAETKSEESRSLPSFVIWLCVALGVLTVISLAAIGICCNRAKNRKKNTALLTRSISHRNDPVPEVPSPVRTNVFSYDYDEIPELSDEISGRSQVYVDEGQKVLRVGVARSVGDTANIGGIMTRDDVRKGKGVKYLSVTDVVTPEGYIDVIG